MTPLKAIRAKCLDCSNGSSAEVNLCPIVECPLYPYRHGRHPKLEGKGHAPSEASLKALQEINERRRKNK